MSRTYTDNKWTRLWADALVGRSEAAKNILASLTAKELASLKKVVTSLLDWILEAERRKQRRPELYEQESNK